MPATVLDPDTPDRRATRIIRNHDSGGFRAILQTLASAEPPIPETPAEAARNLAHAARLVRDVVSDHCRSGAVDPVVSDLRVDFIQTLFSRAEAGGYDSTDENSLFSNAFAQTLVFGLLLARDRSGKNVGPNAHELLPDTSFPLLRGTLRAQTVEEVRRVLGTAFDVATDAVNSVDPALLRPTKGRDPLLYLYEDFLRVFDPEAVKRYGVYYTPPDVVRLMVAEVERLLRRRFRTNGLLDEKVNLLDPACGTGTFLIAATSLAAERATRDYGPAAAAAEVAAFAQRAHAFELLAGPYTVAHYRMQREVSRRGGRSDRLPIFLTDTLAPAASEAGVQPNMAFLSAPLIAEREAADQVKTDKPILVVMGNPPYKRLRSDEATRLVGPFMNRLWNDLKQPVREAGLRLATRCLRPVGQAQACTTCLPKSRDPDVYRDEPSRNGALVPSRIRWSRLALPGGPLHVPLERNRHVPRPVFLRPVGGESPATDRRMAGQSPCVGGPRAVQGDARSEGGSCTFDRIRPFCDWPSSVSAPGPPLPLQPPRVRRLREARSSGGLGRDQLRPACP